MIVGFRHKGLEALYRTGSTRGVPTEQAPKLKRILAALDAAAAARELNHPGYKLHPLKDELSGFWSIWGFRGQHTYLCGMAALIIQ